MFVSLMYCFGAVIFFSTLPSQYLNNQKITPKCFPNCHDGLAYALNLQESTSTETETELTIFMIKTFLCNQCVKNCVQIGQCTPHHIFNLRIIVYGRSTLVIGNFLRFINFPVRPLNNSVSFSVIIILFRLSTIINNQVCRTIAELCRTFYTSDYRTVLVYMLLFNCLLVL